MIDIKRNVKYISGQDGIVHEVILPIAFFKKIVDELENKELIEMMKEIEEKSSDYLSEEESFELIDYMIENCEITAE